MYDKQEGRVTMNPFYDQFKQECLYGEGFENPAIGPLYKSVMYQRGYGFGYTEPDIYGTYGLGLGDTLSRVYQFALPIVKKGLQYLGKKAVGTVANIAEDAIKGRNIPESTKQHVTKATGEIFAKAPEAIAQVMDKRNGQTSSSISLKRSRKRVTSQPKRKKFGKGLLATYPLLDKLE